jgi:acid stress-induced BolA-like protein IbaG/YrbA
VLPTAKQVRQYIEAGLPCEYIDVEGDGQHFSATIVSQAFEGKPTLQRHRIVYQALGERMKAEIHALSMKTMTFTEWRSL